MTVHGDQEQPCFTFTVVIVKGEGVVPTRGVHVVTGVVTGNLTLAGGDLLVDGLTLWCCLKKERSQVNLQEKYLIRIDSDFNKFRNRDINKISRSSEKF